MSQHDEQEVAKSERASASESILDTDNENRLKREHDSIEREDEFHVIIEQDEKLSVVPSGAVVPFPPSIETVYVFFADGVEFLNYTVELRTNFVASSAGIEPFTKRSFQLRQEGGSKWEIPWAVEVAFEEQSGDRIIPTELRFEGLAKPAKLGDVIERGVAGGPDILDDLI